MHAPHASLRTGSGSGGHEERSRLGCRAVEIALHLLEYFDTQGMLDYVVAILSSNNRRSSVHILVAAQSDKGYRYKSKMRSQCRW